MADIWNEEQARRLFGFIAAGGSVGGLLGPLLAKQLVDSIGNTGLLLVAAALLSGAIVCLLALMRRLRSEALAQTTEVPTREMFAGSSLRSVELVLRSPFLVGIAALVCIGSIIAQFAYIETGRLAKAVYKTQAGLTVFYADIDLWTNVITLCFQTLVVGFLTSRFGIRAPLIGLAVIGCLSFVPVALSPTLGVLAVTNVIRRASEYGLGKPGRDMLYTVSTSQEKYLAKNVIDTLVYRGSDSLGNWLHSVLIVLGCSLAGLGAIAAVLAGASAFVAFGVVRGYRARGGK